MQTLRLQELSTRLYTRVSLALSPYLSRHSLPCHSDLLYAKTTAARSRFLLFDMSHAENDEQTHTCTLTDELTSGLSQFRRGNKGMMLSADCRMILHKSRP